MTSDSPSPVVTAMEAHDAFERSGDGFELTTSELETSVHASTLSAERYAVRVSVAAPSLDASVADQSVGTAVQSSWLETFERRLEDAFHVTRTSDHDPPQVSHEGATVWVELTFETTDPDQGVDDAKALGEFVEGTYLEGLIPGYTYRGPAKQLLERAHQRGSGPAP